MQRLDFRAMGCQMLALMDSEDADATEALTLVPGWFEEWEASLSRFREESELSALNRSSGQWVRVSETMWQMIRRRCPLPEKAMGWSRWHSWTS